MQNVSYIQQESETLTLKQWHFELTEVILCVAMCLTRIIVGYYEGSLGTLLK